MNYFSAFDISASGMSVERLRLDVTAMNLANAHTTRSAEGELYKPMRVVVSPRQNVTFDQVFGAMQARALGGAPLASVEEMDAEPRMVFDPSHPEADEKGFIAYPNVDPVSEMVNLITTTRAYEANVRAFNAAKTMALKALEIGGGS